MSDETPTRVAEQAGKRIAAILVGIGVAIVVLAFVVNLILSRIGGLGGGLGVSNFRAQAQAENEPAPTFVLPSLHDLTTTISLRSYRGHLLVLNFWASWCNPCRLEARGLERTWEGYRSRGVQFLGINERDNDPAALAYQGEFDITYPSVFDPAGSLADDYSLIGIPATFVIDASGRIRFRFVGYVDERDLQVAVNTVLQEQT